MSSDALKIYLQTAHATVITPQPGDIVAVVFPMPLSPEGARRAAEALHEAFGPNVRVLIADNGARLEVIRAERKEEAPS